jgi:2-haloacid dehalogenase
LTKTIKVCLFDAYGTLFDLHSAVARYSSEVGALAAGLSELWRNKQLEYSWIRSSMAEPADGWRDFWYLTQAALDFAMEKHAIVNPSLRKKLLDAYLTLDVFPEVRLVLERLKNAGLRTAIISNGTGAMLQSAISSAGIGSLIDTVVSADEVRVFKPSPRLYQAVVTKLRVDKEEVLFHSSNAWDAAAAASFGFHVARIDRTKQPREYEFAPISISCSSLNDIPELVSSVTQR